MNPYTQTLVKQLKDNRLVDFVAHWDRLEELVIRVYRAKYAAPDDEQEYQVLRSWLLGEYPHWQAVLESYWPLALVAGQPPREDPFTFLLGVPTASSFVRNRSAMTTLPAARQALNQFLQARIES
jgi:hypothetical protein